MCILIQLCDMAFVFNAQIPACSFYDISFDRDLYALLAVSVCCLYIVFIQAFNGSGLRGLFPI